MVKNVDRILQYVVHSIHVGLSYVGFNWYVILKGYCDASFGAVDKNEDQQSSYVWIFFLGGYAFLWLAKRHSTALLLTRHRTSISRSWSFLDIDHHRCRLEGSKWYWSDIDMRAAPRRYIEWVPHIDVSYCSAPTMHGYHIHHRAPKDTCWQHVATPRPINEENVQTDWLGNLCTRL